MDMTNLQQGPPPQGQMPQMGQPPGMQDPSQGQQGFPPEFSILEAIMQGGTFDCPGQTTYDFSVIPEEVRAGISDVIMQSSQGGQEGQMDQIGDRPIGPDPNGQGQPMMPGMQGGQQIPPEILQQLMSQGGR